ncbi:hypothetical protein J2W51_000225 [Tardiphaga robiniae]|nr:hypothetical protein [Tardiphaga robiniae]
MSARRLYISRVQALRLLACESPVTDAWPSFAISMRRNLTQLRKRG